MLPTKISKQNWSVKIATLCLPSKIIAPGTVGSLVTSILLWQLSNFGLLVQINLGCLLIVSLAAFLIIRRALIFFAQKDPSIICLDESVGILVSIYLLPINLFNILMAFSLFRFFDILKPLGIKKLENLSGAWGVLLDDILAGIYANLVLRFILAIL
jgi:phosphatidylglycerophosphatase A